MYIYFLWFNQQTSPGGHNHPPPRCCFGHPRVQLASGQWPELHVAVKAVSHPIEKINSWFMTTSFIAFYNNLWLVKGFNCNLIDPVCNPTWGRISGAGPLRTCVDRETLLKLKGKASGKPTISCMINKDVSCMFFHCLSLLEAKDWNRGNESCNSQYNLDYFELS